MLFVIVVTGKWNDGLSWEIQENIKLWLILIGAVVTTFNIVY